MKLSSYFNNPIFHKTLRLAKCILTNRSRLMVLLNQLGNKISAIENKNTLGVDAKKKICLFGRLLKAFTSGDYRSLSLRASISIIAAVLYFVNPADIIPDFIPLTGLLDDFSILVWTYNSLQSELDKFLKWENANPANK